MRPGISWHSMSHREVRGNALWQSLTKEAPYMHCASFVNSPLDRSVHWTVMADFRIVRFLRWAFGKLALAIGLAALAYG